MQEIITHPTTPTAGGLKGAPGSFRSVANIAVPSIVSNITVPLLGLVDVAITGHLGAAAYIAAISIGSMVFNTTYWLCGFLRMGSSGLTAQALGRRDLSETMLWLKRALALALTIGLLLIALQWPLREGALWLMSPTEDVRRLVVTYFNICIWGAPAMLGLYAMNGWFIGMQNSRIPMAVAITQNVVNIAASLLLVFALGMKVEGVATGTLIAQWTGLLMALCMFRRFYAKHLSPQRKSPLGFSPSGGRKEGPGWASIFRGEDMKRFFQVNRDFFLRTLCLVSVMLFFTAAGSRQGEVILAANTLLMQLYLLFSYVMDGFANAAEALSGKSWGARNATALRRTVACCFAWGAACAALFTLLYTAGGEAFLQMLTDEPSVVSVSRSYVAWAYLVPACSLAAFVWDGVFIGITASRQMLISSLLAALVFFALYAALRPHLANHALWLAFLGYMLTRGIAQTILFRAVCRRAKM